VDGVYIIRWVGAVVDQWRGGGLPAGRMDGDHAVAICSAQNFGSQTQIFVRLPGYPNYDTWAWDAWPSLPDNPGLGSTQPCHRVGFGPDFSPDGHV
jgi:hypothetical protein